MMNKNIIVRTISAKQAGEQGVLAGDVAVAVCGKAFGEVEVGCSAGDGLENCSRDHRTYNPRYDAAHAG